MFRSPAHASPPRTRLSRWRRLGALAACALAAAAGTAIAAPVPTQPVSEAGLPEIRNFDTADYGGATQNWALAQDAKGVLYVGNVESGVLVYDGSRWQRVKVPDQMVVRSLAAAPDGRVYVGTVGNFGYLQAAADGRLAYVSLLDQLPADARDFSDVWKIYANDSDVYFLTLTYLFRLHDGRISVIKPRGSFHLGFMVDDQLYIREIGHGLMQVTGDRLSLAPGGKRFADDALVALLPWRGVDARPGQLLAATRSGAWLRWDGKQWLAWRTDADAEFKRASIYGAVWLADGRLAVGSLHDGLFILDVEGRLQSHLTRASGLTTNVLLGLLQDRQQGLWLATDDVISRVSIASPITRFDERNGLHGIVLGLARHRGVLFAGTTKGMFRLRASRAGEARFERIPGTGDEVWSFASLPDSLLAGGNDGVLALAADGRLQSVLDAARHPEGVATRAILRSKAQPGRVFVAYENGVGTLLRQHGRWIDEGMIAGLAQFADNMVEDQHGQLWLGQIAGGVARVNFPADWQGAGDPRPVTVHRYDSQSGLPRGRETLIVIDGTVHFGTRAGVYRYDERSQRFAPDPAFAGLFPDGPREIVTAHADASGSLWLYTADNRNHTSETGYAAQIDGQWRWQTNALRPIADIGTNVIATDANGIAWLGGDKGIYRYDLTQPVMQPRPVSALIRAATRADGHPLALRAANGQLPELPYARNSLRIEYAAPSFDDARANRYQVRLDGLDANWSAWSADVFRDYTNLPAGEYRFRVRSRDVYGNLGDEASFAFRVLPPWYFSGWAWALWIATVLALLGLLLRWRSASLQRRNLELSQLVGQRAAELHAANAALAASNLALAEQSATDPLTGLKNRRHFYERIEQDMAQLRRSDAGSAADTNLLFMLIDIDHFKRVNDSFGHAAGDRVLQQMRDILLSLVRESDLAVRWGGEEFMLMLRFVPAAAGPEFAERIRAAVAAHRFDLGDGRHIRIGCSIGFACYSALASKANVLDWEQVVTLADECLYAAKRHSRDAWVGVMPLPGMPVDVPRALAVSLANWPQAGPLPVRASWFDVRTQPRQHAATDGPA